MKMSPSWLVVGMVFPVSATAQTFYQLTDLGQGISPRLTAAQPVQEWGRYLFGGLGGGTTYNNHNLSGAIVQFVADPVWNRVVYAKKDVWIRFFDNVGGSGGGLSTPTDVDVSAGDYVFIADRDNRRVMVSAFNGEQISNAVYYLVPSGGTPIGVAWDGGSTPLTTNNAYVVSESGAVVTYWVGSGGSWYGAWSYGAFGNETDEFWKPTAVCVGHAQAANGGSVFTSNFYVTDAAKRRIVWLGRLATGATWKGSAVLPDSGTPSDCTVDHFGNVYVTDSRNSRILKYTSSLSLLKQYGAFGMGSSLNSFAHPGAIHVPFGKATVGGQGVWQGQGRIVTGERWSLNSGVVEHWLGVEVPQATASVGDGVAWVSSSVTDHAYVTIAVAPASGYGTVRALSVYSFRAPGPLVATWDGLKDDGTPAPTGDYRFSVDARSGYGCYYGQPWCWTSRSSQNFHWNECSPGGGGIDPSKVAVDLTPSFAQWQPPPCSTANPQNVSLLGADVAISGVAPSALGLRQVLLDQPRPLLRVEAVGGAGAAFQVPEGVSGIPQFVRQHGVRGLGIDIPAAEDDIGVRIRVYDLRGHLVRDLVNEPLRSGSYVIGWDGLDSSGRPVQPGVYIAYMTAGSYRGASRLIIK